VRRFASNVTQREDDAIVDKPLEGAATCWWCQQRNADRMQKFTLTRDTQKFKSLGSTKTTWRETEVPIPRCKTCKRIHRRTAHRWIPCLGVAIIGATACGLLLGAGAAMICGVVLFVAWWLIERAIISRQLAAAKSRPYGTAAELPAVQKLIADGWKAAEFDH
jgi:hypothetical protein